MAWPACLPAMPGRTTGSQDKYAQMQDMCCQGKGMEEWLHIL